MNSAELVIVGAGPAGISTALAIIAAMPEARDKILLLEKHFHPRDKPCAGALGARGTNILQKLGVHTSTRAIPIHGFQVTTTAGTSLFHSPETLGRVILRGELDAELADIARQRGIPLAQGVSVSSVREQAGRVLLETSAGVLDSSLVVGADGVGSVVRRSMDLPKAGFKAQVLELTTAPCQRDPPPGVLGFDLSDRRIPGYLWNFPRPAGRYPLRTIGLYSLSPSTSGFLDIRKPPGHLIRLLREHVESQGIKPHGQQALRFAERGYNHVSSQVVGRRMLVGEAAGIDPISGEGIAHAIEFGALAGRFLAKTGLDPAQLPAWTKVLRRSRLGMDLFLCQSLLRAFYGGGRERTEAMMIGSRSLLKAVSLRFAGRYPGPLLLLQAILGSALAAARISKNSTRTRH